jgi:hypothetical protein
MIYNIGGSMICVDDMKVESKGSCCSWSHPWADPSFYSGHVQHLEQIVKLASAKDIENENSP